MSNEPELVGVLIFVLSVLGSFAVMCFLVMAAKEATKYQKEMKEAYRRGLRKDSWWG